MTNTVPETFIQVTREDPLFAAEGCDIAEARRALAVLFEQTRDIEQIWARQSFFLKMLTVRYPFERSLHALTFIERLLDAEEARRRFEREQTIKSAESLIVAYEHAVAEYRACVRAYSGMLATLRKKQPDIERIRLVDMFCHAHTMRSIDAEIELLRENADVLAGEVAVRKDLLNGGQASEGERAKSQLPSGTVIPEGELTAWERGLAERLMRFMPYPYTNIRKSAYVRQTLPHFDGVPTDHVFLVTSGDVDEFGAQPIRIMCIDVLYLLSLAIDTNAPHIESEITNPLRAYGFQYWNQPAIFLYTTRDVSYWPFVTTAADRHWRPDLSERVCVQQSSTLAGLLWSFVFQERTVQYITRTLAKSNNVQSPLYMLLFRSYPSFYLFPFNASVWRLSYQPDFLGKWISRSSPYLSQEMVRALSWDTIDETLQGACRRHALWREEFGF